MTGPLELLLEGWETRARQLNEISRTEEDAPRSWYYGGRAAELTDCIAALHAQAEAGAGEAELLAELREALTAFDAASEEEDAALNALMSASQNAPKNERGQYLDPGAVRRAAEPFRPRHRAAQDARMEAQDVINGLALESARLAVKLAGGLPALAQADAGGGG